MIWFILAVIVAILYFLANSVENNWAVYEVIVLFVPFMALYLGIWMNYIKRKWVKITVGVAIVLVICLALYFNTWFEIQRYNIDHFIWEHFRL